MAVRKWGAEALVNTNTESSQDSSAVTALASGDYVVTWTDGDPASDGSTAAIKMQRYDAFGVKLGGETLVNTTTGGAQLQSTVTTLADGSFVVAWRDFSGANGTGQDIRFRHFEADGTPIDAADRLAIAFPGTEQDPIVKALPDGGFVIIADADRNIRAQRFDADGAPVGTIIDVAVSSATEIGPDIAVLANGSMAAIYEDSGVDDLKLQLINANGTLNGASITVSNDLDAGFEGSVVKLAQGGFVVVWRDGDVRAQAFLDNGAKTGAEITVSQIPAGADTDDPAVTALAGGGFAVAMELDNEIRIRVFNAAGAPQGLEFVVNTTLNGDQFGTAIEELADGRLVVTWTDKSASGGDTSGDAIRQQILDPRDGIVDGTAENDTLIGHDVDPDTITGLAGNDTLFGLGGDDTIDAGDGSDTLIGGLGADTLDGGAGAGFKDTASYVNATARVVVALDGTLSTEGEAIGDVFVSIENLTGSKLNDRLRGDNGVNDLRGDAGNDTIEGGAGNDKLFGQDGDDTLIGGAGADTLNGGAGLDTASYLGAAAAVIASLPNAAINSGDAAGDTFVSVENLIGSSFDDALNGNNGVNDIRGDAGNDTIKGASGNDRLFGQDGNDTLIGGVGADTLNGGSGLDTASYLGATAGVIASLPNAAINSGDAAGDTFVSIENLIGSGFNDALNGSNGVNDIRGDAGNDSIKSAGGNDTLTGGVGLDAFIFNTALNAATNVDTITDFSAADDTIQLDNLVFTAFAATGALASGFFRANATGTAQDSNDHIVYETDTGKLFYDADGNGAGAAIQFARLTGNPAISAADFTVV